ncbi:MAG: (2Fe-2S)-binding protein [Thermoplasmata archaeon]|nr:(2Fe-2S)-binding protein [Thermoplasmata archaeon]
MTSPLRLLVNGVPVETPVPPSERLLDTLRWRLGLRGTKEGCRTGACGACTVLIGGHPRLSCLTLSHQVGEEPILTVEGLESDPVGRAVMDVFVAEAALQCGYCTPGFVVALTGLLKEHPGASESSLLEGLQGNLCRCTGYSSIRRAVTRLAEPAP